MRFIPEFLFRKVPFVNPEQQRLKQIDYAQFTKEKLIDGLIISAFLTQRGVHIDYSPALMKGKCYQPGLRILNGANAGKIPIPGVARSGQTVYSVSYLVPKTHQDYEAAVNMLDSAGFLT